MLSPSPKLSNISLALSRPDSAKPKPSKPLLDTVSSIPSSACSSALIPRPVSKLLVGIFLNVGSDKNLRIA